MYDVAIIGGGLSGLSTAIQLSKAGLEVILFEKKQYPFHRVCGEYISMETIPFLNKHLDFDPFDHGAIFINHLQVSSPKGKIIELPLDLGGFGLSRYRLDDELQYLAQRNGVAIKERTNVLSVAKQEKAYEITSNRGVFKTKMVIGAFGKRSNMDRSLQRASFYKRSPYIGVKHHLRISNLMPENHIALHNFKDGYCGISRVEGDIYCLCYLSHRKNIKRHKKIPSLEQSVLQKNPLLDYIFKKGDFIWEKPLVINEVSFAKKSLREDGIWMCGDTAGMIAPLCGNGMAMAFHSSYLLSQAIIDIFKNNTPTNAAFLKYQKEWRATFGLRLATGRTIQRLFGHPVLTEVFINSLKVLPFAANNLVKLTHGKSWG